MPGEKDITEESEVLDLIATIDVTSEEISFASRTSKMGFGPLAK